MTKALVTGGAGFIGSHVAELFIANGLAKTYKWFAGQREGMTV